MDAMHGVMVGEAVLASAINMLEAERNNPTEDMSVIMMSTILATKTAFSDLDQMLTLAFFMGMAFQKYSSENSDINPDLLKDVKGL